MHVNQELGTLEYAGLIRRVDDAEFAYLFKHILTQESAYASLLRQERRKLHRLVAESCEQLFAAQPDEYLALLAHHYTEAGEPAKAVTYWTRYGERALQVSAFPEAIHAFEQALALLPAEDGAARANVHVQLGDIYCRRTNYAVAEENFSSALKTAIAAQDAKTAAAALSGVARIQSQRGEHTRARELGIEALRWAQDANDDAALARAHRQLGIAFNYEGVNELAEQHLHAGLERFQKLDDADGVASCLNSLGVVARDEGELERAQAYFEQALAISQQLGDRYSTGIRLVNLGVIAEQRGDLDAAARYQREALTLAEEIGDREGIALVRSNLGSLAQSRGDLETAAQEYRAALAEAVALGVIGLALYVIAAIAKLQVARGNLVHGAELLGLAFHHPASTADVLNDFESVREELQTKLGKAELDAAMERGRAANLQATVAQLLGETK